MGLLSKLFGRDDVAARDAQRIYQALMTRARSPEFYGAGKIPDTQTGRIECLILHVAPVMNALVAHGEQGKRLSQALFDTLKADFEIALREEGYSDAGVKRRIKPMIQRFYAGLKAYTEALSDADVSRLETAIATDLEDTRPAFVRTLAAYMRDFRAGLSDVSLGTIAQADFVFPDLA